VNKEFLFNAGTRQYGHADPNELGRQGIEDDHAYSLLRAVDYDGNRLCLVKNPWGETEWNGPWSDGSKEWTPEAMKALEHKFGNEGIFWMPYADFLRRYSQIWRTRLFTDEWNIAQHWTTIQVPWAGDYNDTKFEFDLPKAAKTVIVLSQLDTRYFMGLTGQYTFQLTFRLHQSGEKQHIIRGYSSGDRSATTEVDLEAGTYEVLLQISGQRDSTLPKVEDVVTQNWLARREKLMTIGLSYDVANAKGQGKEPEPKASTTDVAPSAPSAPSAPAVAVDASNVDTTAAEGTSVDATFTVDTEADAAPDEAPWDAVCVVGLKVFSPGTAAVIRVVKPTAASPAVGKANLDVDDPEKDATEKVAK
jgi:Calpain family cysteine protease